MENLFGEVIYSYTRKQAIDDGVLIDVSETAKEAGFRFPVAITDSVYNILNPGQYATKQGQSFSGRLWDSLNMLRYAIKISDGSTIKFKVKISGQWHDLKAICGPGDTPDPVITIMLPNED